MIGNLKELNKEAQEIRETLQAIQDFPDDIKELMMDKLRNNILDIPEKVEKPVKITKKHSCCYSSLEQQILEELPEMTPTEAGKYAQEVRRKYYGNGVTAQQKIVSEISSVPHLAKVLKYDKSTIHKSLKPLVNDGVVGKVKLNPHKKSLGIFYKIKKEGAIVDAPIYSKNTRPWKNSTRPWVTLKNSKGYTLHRTKEERDLAFKIGGECNWDKARMYELPDYVTWGDDDEYDIYIPGTEKLLFEKVSLRIVRRFVEWIGEAVDYDGGAEVHFNTYYQVYFAKNRINLPQWEFKTGVNIIRGTSINRLSENMRKQGHVLAKLPGHFIVDLEDLL
jgi:hypothetical protein